MAKCPWCGKKTCISGSTINGFYHCCERGCYRSTDLFNTESEALDAASKRFMPKRTVEEICRYVEKTLEDQDIEFNSLSEKQQEECVDFMDVVRATRIADFIYGVE